MSRWCNVERVTRRFRWNLSPRRDHAGKRIIGGQTTSWVAPLQAGKPGGHTWSRSARLAIDQLGSQITRWHDGFHDKHTDYFIFTQFPRLAGLLSRTPIQRSDGFTDALGSQRHTAEVFSTEEKKRGSLRRRSEPAVIQRSNFYPHSAEKPGRCQGQWAPPHDSTILGAFNIASRAISSCRGDDCSQRNEVKVSVAPLRRGAV